ncbi:MAG: ZIP family metal transporter [Vicinamibacteria bacterium]
MSDVSPWFLGLIAALANIAGGLILVSRRHWNDLILRYFVGLGAGFMLATTLLHMMPVAVTTSHGPFLVLAGYLLVHFFEHTVAPHFHFGEETHAHAMEPPSASWTALAGLSVHAFFDGLSIASGFAVSRSLGVLVFFAILLHKVPEGFTVASIAIASGQGRKGALRSSLILASATLLGSFALIDPAWASFALPLSAGVTFYVAASDLIPEVNAIRGMRMGASVFAGVALSLIGAELLELLGLH